MIATRFASVVLLAVVLTAATGCKPKQQPDPLAGWKKYGSVAGLPVTDTGYRLSAQIMSNYQAYIEALPKEEKALAKSGAELYFCEDGTGQHAVEIVIPLKGTYWTHVLVYDKSNKRVKSMKFRSGRYAS